MESYKLKYKVIDCFHLTIFISVSAKKLMRKRSKEDKQTLEELNSAHRRSQAKCKLVQTSYIKRIKLFLILPYNKHLISRTKSADMYVAHILRIELHECVVYQLHRRRLLISLYSRNFDKQFFCQRKSILPFE